MRLQGYVDADWAGSAVDRKSTSGCCFTLGSVMVSLVQHETELCGFEYRRSRVYSVECGSSREAMWLHKLTNLFDVIAQFVARRKGYKVEGQTGVTGTYPTQCHHDGEVLSL
jgi:hypothetical protein